MALMRLRFVSPSLSPMREALRYSTSEIVRLDALNHVTKLCHGLSLCDGSLLATALLGVVRPLRNVVSKVVRLLGCRNAVRSRKAEIQLLGAVDILNAYRVRPLGSPDGEHRSQRERAAAVQHELPATLLLRRAIRASVRLGGPDDQAKRAARRARLGRSAWRHNASAAQGA